ncbi:uncharacterized protein [Solanum lycopersicum]|uniref:uncharacterized protein n=1 Tax=Solanum lycopersicum TaxID=4081 RepID=UPI0037492AB1
MVVNILDHLTNTASIKSGALLTVAYVINLSPAVALQSDVPNSVWYGKDISYDHLRVYDYKAFVHVPKDERSKLDAKNQTIEDIEKVEKVESSSFDDIVHHDDVPHTSVHDVIGLDYHDDTQNHVSNKHVDVDNNKDIVIHDPVAHQVMD